MPIVRVSGAGVAALFMAASLSRDPARDGGAEQGHGGRRVSRVSSHRRAPLVTRAIARPAPSSPPGDSQTAVAGGAWEMRAACMRA